MSRSPATAAALARQSTLPQPETAAPARLASPIGSSPRMLAQRRQIQSLFGPRAGLGGPPAGKGVVQGYFVLGRRNKDDLGQNTNDPDQFMDGDTQADKEERLWPVLKDAIEADWQKLPGNHFKANAVEEFKTRFLATAFAAAESPMEEAINLLEGVAQHRAQARTPLKDTASPGGVGGKLTTTPSLGDKEKHSLATYTRTIRDAAPVSELFDSDAYTKGPARRTRDPDGLATTPASGVQAWTREQVNDSLRLWTCEAPLARHLAFTVWPLLGDTAIGKKWEVKFREMDRLITLRDAEPKSQSFTIRRKSTKVAMQTLSREAFTVRAREGLKAALLAGTPHPAEQQGVLFYDALLKQAVNATWQDTASATFAVRGDYAADEDLSMVLTHWRPILLFDWILAEDVLNNASA